MLYYHRWIETLVYQKLCPVVVVQLWVLLVAVQRRTHLVAAVQGQVRLVAAVQGRVRLVAVVPMKLTVWDLQF